MNKKEKEEIGMENRKEIASIIVRIKFYEIRKLKNFLRLEEKMFLYMKHL